MRFLVFVFPPTFCTNVQMVVVVFFFLQMCTLPMCPLTTYSVPDARGLLHHFEQCKSWVFKAAVQENTGVVVVHICAHQHSFFIQTMAV